MKAVILRVAIGSSPPAADPRRHHEGHRVLDAREDGVLKVLFEVG